MTSGRGPLAFMEKHQSPPYLAAMAFGAAVGLLLPGASGGLAAAINPVLALVLYATFLGVPFARIRSAARDLRFLGTLLALNFVVVPAVVFGLSRFVAGDHAVLLGVLLVLLTPCVDYVIVFTRLAGGAGDRLLAATPLLMVIQLLLLPAYLFLFAGAGAMRLVSPGPFLSAFALIVLLPLLLAALTQRLAALPAAPPSRSPNPHPGVAGRSAGGARRVMAAAEGAMVAGMMVTLAVVVGSQASAVAGRWRSLLVVVPVYAAFLLVMAAVGSIAARFSRLDGPGGLALTLSGMTRNSLVILPLALALPPALGLAPLVIVTQTLVELLGLIVYVRVVPLRRALRP